MTNLDHSGTIVTDERLDILSISHFLDSEREVKKDIFVNCEPVHVN